MGKDLKNGEMEIDLLDISRKIIAIRKILYKAAGFGVIFGIIVGLSIPKQYTVKVTLSPEMGSSKGNSGLSGLAASFLGSGTTIAGDGSDALNVSLAADIVSSTPFLLELLDIDVISTENDTTILASYLDEQRSPWWNYLIDMPGMVVEGVKSLFENDDEKKSAVDISKRGIIELTKKESKKINILRRNITALIDKETAITSIAVTLQNPKVTAVVADSVIYRLQDYIITYRTSKAKDDCIYLEKLYEERRQEYYAAQKKYADYVDTHDNLILQSVRIEQEKLQSDMSLAYQIYSQVANQLQVARAKVQEEKPVFAVVEPAVIPMKTSGFGVIVYILLLVILCVGSTIIWRFLCKDLFKSKK